MTPREFINGIADAVGLPIGTKYNLGWRNGGGGIDCSGFVSTIAHKLGATNIANTDWTGSLFPKTQAISKANAKPGDLVFFGDPNSVDSHVAIWMGGDSIYQSSLGKGVNVGSLSGVSSYYGGQVAYRRIPQLTAAVEGGEPTPAPAPGNGSTPTPAPAPGGGGGSITLPGGITVSNPLQPVGTVLGHLTSRGFWWAVLLFALGAAAIIGGIWLYFSPPVQQQIATIERAAAAAA